MTNSCSNLYNIPPQQTKKDKMITVLPSSTPLLTRNEFLAPTTRHPNTLYPSFPEVLNLNTTLHCHEACLHSHYLP